MKVTLRQRKQTKKGKISLYLELYKGTTKTQDGKTKILRDYEYLDMFLLSNPKTPEQKQQNKETLKLAEKIATKRQNEIDTGKYGFTSSFKLKTNFIEYFKALMEKRKDGKGNYGNWSSALKHLVNYCDVSTTFKEIDVSFVEGFKEYLQKKAMTKSNKNLSINSQLSYFNKLRACLNQAVEDDIILKNPAKKVTGIKKEETQREYLTIDELRQLAKTECRYDVLKRAFLFSCLTGLRWSDVNKLTWGEVQQYNDNLRIVFNQKKTKGLQYLDISKQAEKYLGEQKEHFEKVFSGLRYSTYMNIELQRWVLKAGITKNITFHCARHTFAVLQLDLGTEIYTLSKLLGHSELKTTQIYAKIIDKKKVEAMNKIPDIEI